jgi:hypothetical protein
MNSETKTEEFNKWCKGCEEWTNKYGEQSGNDLCEECDRKYDNKTGYCSLSCCLGGGCDESC